MVDGFQRRPNVEAKEYAYRKMLEALSDGAVNPETGAVDLEAADPSLEVVHSSLRELGIGYDVSGAAFVEALDTLRQSREMRPEDFNVQT